MKKFLAVVITLTVIGMSSASAQNQKVAVFDPAGSVDASIKEIVREEISSIVVNSGGYTVLERQLIEKVLEENKFQLGGLVDDSQISEIGKRMGANLVFVSSITSMNNNFYISCKMIDVQTARIEKQKTAQTSKGMNDLISVIQKTVTEMFSEIKKTSGNVTKTEEKQQESKTIVEEKPITPTDKLVVNGSKVFMSGRELDKIEVKRYMANTDALNVYNKGLKKGKTGTVWMITGATCVVGGAILAFAGGFYEYDHDVMGWKDGPDGPAKSGDNRYWSPGANIGVSLISVGVVGLTTGIVLKSSGKKDIRKAVDAYNYRNSLSQAELNFGFTGNGVGLVLNF